MKKISIQNDIWLLLDERTGNRTQVLGVGNALNTNYTEKLFKYNVISKLPNWLLQASILHVNKKSKKQFKPPWPKIVIGCGRKSSPAGLWIKEKSANKTHFIQIMWPGWPYKNIDLIAIPEHDKINPKINTINFLTSPHIFAKEYLNKAKIKWSKTLDTLPYPRIAVSIGGDTKKNKFLPSHSSKMIKLLIKFIGSKGSLMVTTSRRTSNEVYERIKNEVDILGKRVILWKMDLKNNNPYPGFLSYADAVAVTGDSISLCSEACSTGKPVLIFAPENTTTLKQKTFHQALIKKGIAKYLEDTNLDILKKISYHPLNESQYIAEEIKKRFLN